MSATRPAYSVRSCASRPLDRDGKGNGHAQPAARPVAPGSGTSDTASCQLLVHRVRRLPPVYLAMIVMCTFAVLFVGWEVIQRYFLSSISIGMKHLLLTAHAAVVTAVTCTIVYRLMHRQQRELASAAEQIAGLLEAYRADSTTRSRFHNPHLVHCRDLLDCQRSECPMFTTPGDRCWQTITLRGAWRGPDAPPPSMNQCHTCEVFRQSCPDALTKLGESFNNLMFLLEEEAAQVGRMRAQMVEKEKMVAIGQMASGIAHEIGNPLSSISSIVQMLKRYGAQAPVTEQLELIQTHIQRISTTVRQLGSLARPSPQRWEKASVGTIVDDAVRLISFDRRARNVDIDIQCPQTLPQTYAHRGRLQQVFINLLLNALDAMPGGGRLTVSAQHEDGAIRVRVQDDGCGIAETAGRRVFEPFFTTKEPGHGTGLGLSVSYGIVREHGGSIDFDSRPGHGTTFTVELPVLNKAPDS